MYEGHDPWHTGTIVIVRLQLRVVAVASASVVHCCWNTVMANGSLKKLRCMGHLLFSKVCNITYIWLNW